MIKNILKTSINYIAQKKITKFFLNCININTVFLNYHRVISDENYESNNRPDNDLIVSMSIFEKQIKFLKENFNIVSINDLQKLDKNTKNVVITFDDGYLDNLENALPILQKYECPAIIYIVTSFLDNKNYPWWLRIWNILEINNYLLYEKHNLDISNKKLKLKQYNLFCKKIINLNKHNQDIFFDRIYKQNNYLIDKNIEFLTTEKLIELNKSPLIEIGCHTHSHQNLQILNEDELNEEIRISKIFLEKTLDQEINHFSIPYGTKKNFSKKTLETLSNFNFKTIVTTEQGNFDKKHLYRIPRIGVGNHDLGNRLYSKAIGLDSLINKILSR
jgi:peptidoglycan/xylan/chitin deacetylase (PgdA/CDA1 family)